MNEKQNQKHWNVLDSSIAFENRWMKVKRDVVMLPNGKVLDDYYLWIAGSCRTRARICAMCCGELHKYRLDHNWWLPATVKVRKIK